MAERPHPNVISLNEVRWGKAYRKLLDRLQDFAEQCLEEEPWAEDLFYGYQPDDTETDALHEAFLDWAAFDYRDWDGLTLLERFRTEAGPWDPTEEAMLKTWQGAHLSLYRVHGEENGMVRLHACLTGDDIDVQSDEDIKPFAAGDLVICRVLPVGTGFRFAFDVRTCPAEAEPAILQAMEAELARLRHQNPHATWADLLSRRWPLVHDAITSAIVNGSAPPRLAPATPPSLGRTEAPDTATPMQRDAAAMLARYLAEEEVSHDERQRAARLWWDAVAAINPTSGKAEGWAAGAAYAFFHYAVGDETTQQDVADAFGLSAPTVGNRAKAIAAGLRLEEMDERYADPLDPRVRFSIFPLFPGSPLADAAPAMLTPEEAAAEAADVMPLMLEGQALLHQGQPARAREKFMRALELVPDAVPIRNTLAMTYLMEGSPEEAIRTAYPVLQSDPHSVQTLALLAICHMLTGDAELALRFGEGAAVSYSRARKHNREYDPEERASDLQMVVEALSVTENDEELLALLKDEPVTNLDPGIMERAAEAATHLGRRQEAHYWRAMAEKKRR